MTGGLSNDSEESNTPPPPTQRYSCYDLDDLDVAWLELVNYEFRQMGECSLTQRLILINYLMNYIKKKKKIVLFVDNMLTS